MYKVYKHTSPNGKVYIGITNQNPVRRWGCAGQGYKENEYFYKAIQKYGWDNFKHEILMDGLTEDEACNEEIRLIEEYRSTDRACGYNRHSGGKVHDTVSAEDLIEGDFKSYSEVKASPVLYDIFKKMIESAKGFDYDEQTDIVKYKNGAIVESKTVIETKHRNPSYLAICMLLNHYRNANEVIAILPDLMAAKQAIEEEL